MELTSNDEKKLEEQLNALQPSPSPRFYRRMARAAWTTRAVARRRALTVSGLTVLIAAFLLVVTPQGRTWAQELIHFFTRAPSDVLSIEPFQGTAHAIYVETFTPANVTSTPDPAFDFNLSVPDAGKHAGFTVRTPSWLPDILTFVDASYQPDHNIVRVFYRYNQDAADTTNGLVLREERFQTNDDCSLCGLVGASEKIEPVMIGNNSGDYIIGVWKLTDNGPVWEPDPDLQTLRWQADGMAFELLYMGIPDEVTKADMIAIATSIK